MNKKIDSLYDRVVIEREPQRRPANPIEAEFLSRTPRTRQGPSLWQRIIRWLLP